MTIIYYFSHFFIFLMNKWFSLFPQGERDSFAAQAPRGAGGAGTHFAAAVFPHGADAGLRFPLRLFRRGLRLMLSCREAVGADTVLRFSSCAGGAAPPRGTCIGAHRAKEISFALLSFSSLSVQATHFAAAGVSFFYDSFCSFELHLSLHFLPVLTGRKRSKGRNSRPRPRPEKSDRSLPSAQLAG